MSKPRTDGRVDSSCSRANLLRLREVAGLSLTEATHPPGLRVPPHSHEEVHFCLLLQGHYKDTMKRTAVNTLSFASRARWRLWPAARCTPIASTTRAYGSFALR